MEQNVLITKMIGIVVAVIVAAVVLVPICNSLTEGDGGSSSGGSGGDSGSGDVIFTIGDFYSQYYSGWEYESLQTCSPYVEGTHPFDIDSGDIKDIVNSFRAMEIQNGLFVDFQIMAISADGFDVYAEYGYNIFQGGGDEYTIRLFVTTDTDSFTLVVIDDESNNAQYSSSFTFRCGSSQATFEYQYYEGESTVSNSISIPLSSIQFEFLLSKNPAGFIPDTLAYYGGSEPTWAAPVIFKDQKVLLSYAVESTEDTIKEIIPVSIENFDEAVETGDVTFTGTKDSREYSVDCEVSSSDGQYVLDNIHAAVNVSPPYDEGTDVYYYGLYLSNYTGDGGGDSGGDGGSSDTGVTGTLIKAIPIFVILGILLGSVALFYQNRKTI